MKPIKFILHGLLFAGLASAAVAAAANDLILGFTASSGTGQSQSVQLNLGNVGSYVTASAGSNWQLANLNSALTSTYGGDWSTRSDLKFGIIGATGGVAGAGGPNGQPTYTVWASSAWTNQASAPRYTVQSSNAGVLSTTTSDVSGLYNTFSSGTAISDLSSQTSALTGETLSGYINSIDSAGRTQWSTWGLNTLATTNHVTFQATAASGRLDLQQIMPTSSATKVSATDLGYFTLASDGSLSFTTFSAVPEPSAYAAILGAAALGFVMLRRRKETANA